MTAEEKTKQMVKVIANLSLPLNADGRELNNTLLDLVENMGKRLLEIDKLEAENARLEKDNFHQLELIGNLEAKVRQMEQIAKLDQPIVDRIFFADYIQRCVLDLGAMTYPSLQDAIEAWDSSNNRFSAKGDLGAL
jgi:hypothetical protein